MKICLRSRIVFFASLLSASFVSTTMAHSMSVELQNDSIVDPAAWNFVDGRFGTCVNGQTFQQEAVVTHRGHQYAAFFADGGTLAIGRRKLPDGAWEVIRFSDYRAGDHRDAHNVVSMGICDADGTIHLSFDHHNSPMHYRRSAPGLATSPETFEWKASQFGPVTSKIDGQTALGNITYPQFFDAPDGGLQMVYRIGSSGNGDWFLAEYQPAEGKWAILGTLFSRMGKYEQSASRCAYPNPIRYDAAGRLHLTWTWREAPSNHPFDLRTNHDVLYAVSDDRGRSWKGSDGSVVATLGEPAARPLAIDTPGILAHPTKFLWGQMNTTTQFVDSKGRVHVVNWQQPESAEQSSKDLNTWRYVHYWRDENGTWHQNPLPFHGRKPQIVVDPAGNAFIAFTKGENANYHGQDHGGRLTIMGAAESSRWTDWKPLCTVDRMSVGEPLIDPRRWRDEGALSIYLQDKPASPGRPSALRVFDFKVSQ